MYNYTSSPPVWKSLHTNLVFPFPKLRRGRSFEDLHSTLSRSLWFGCSVRATWSYFCSPLLLLFEWRKLSREKTETLPLGMRFKMLNTVLWSMRLLALKKCMLGGNCPVLMALATSFSLRVMSFSLSFCSQFPSTRLPPVRWASSSSIKKSRSFHSGKERQRETRLVTSSNSHLVGPAGDFMSGTNLEESEG